MKKKAKNIIDTTVNGIYTPEETNNKTAIKIPEIGVTILVSNNKLKDKTPQEYKEEYINHYKNRNILW